MTKTPSVQLFQFASSSGTKEDAVPSHLTFYYLSQETHTLFGGGGGGSKVACKGECEKTCVGKTGLSLARRLGEWIAVGMHQNYLLKSDGGL